MQKLSAVALLIALSLSVSCGLVKQDVDQIFVVQPGYRYTYSIQIMCETAVYFEWDSVNRNTSGSALGSAGNLGGLGSIQVGAVDGSPGDVNVIVAGPGVSRNYPRSIRNSIRFTTPERGGVYAFTFDNGFSLVSAKEVHLRGEIWKCS